MKLKLIILNALAISFFLFLPSSVDGLSGSDFHPDRIIDDSIFFNSTGMDVNTIQAFLNSKVPVCDTNHPSSNPSYQPPFTCLKDYREDIPAKSPETSLCNGMNAASNKTSAEIIFLISQTCGVSPKALIVLLEKEQSLVTDTWPWSVQYRSATGYGCPDTAPCDSEYYGFFNQVYNAARQFKRYARDESLYGYRAYRNNFILYNPNSSCGGSTVTIQNQATAGLYNYTPYQPNQAALSNLYGTGDSCSAYGNRNFWRLHNDWFGATTGEGFALMTSYQDNGDTRQWVVYKGIKRHVPSVDILQAWGLDQIPVIQTSGLYLGAIPTASQPLNRLMRPTGTLDVYFVDNGNCYRLTGPDMFTAWGLNPAATVDVSEDLARVPSNKGDLTYLVQPSGASEIYLMDGGVLRHIQNTHTLEAFEGVGRPVTAISLNYFSLTGQGASLPSPRIMDIEGHEYIVSNRKKLKLTSQTSSLFPWTASQVSQYTTQRMATDTIQPFIKADDDIKVYMIDQQQKHHVSDPDVLSGWQVTGQTTTVSRGITDLMTTGSSLSDYFASNASNYYLINKSKHNIPSNLVSAYTGTRTVYPASIELLNIFSTSSAVTHFVKASGQPQAFLLTNSGRIRHISSTRLYNLWAGAQAVTEIPASNLNKYTSDGAVGAYLTDGTSEYVMDGGKKSLVSIAAKTAWGISSPILLNDGTMNNFSNTIDLSNKLFDSGKYYIIDQGIAYLTVDQNIADIWAVAGDIGHNSNIINELLVVNQMTRYAKAKNPADTRLFAVNNGSLYHLSPEHAQNLALSGPIMSVDPDSISVQPVAVWGGILVKSGSDQYYVIDSGGKRFFTNSVISDHWRINVNVNNIPTLTDGFLNMMPTKGPIERAVKGSGNSIFSTESTTKRWVRSAQTYGSQFGVYTTVSDSLVNALPTGPDLP